MDAKPPSPAFAIKWPEPEQLFALRRVLAGFAMAALCALCMFFGSSAVFAQSAPGAAIQNHGLSVLVADSEAPARPKKTEQTKARDEIWIEGACAPWDGSAFMFELPSGAFGAARPFGGMTITVYDLLPDDEVAHVYRWGTQNGAPSLSVKEEMNPAGQGPKGIQDVAVLVQREKGSLSAFRVDVFMHGVKKTFKGRSKNEAPGCARARAPGS